MKQSLCYFRMVFFSIVFFALTTAFAMSSWMPMSVEFAHYLGVHPQVFQWFSSIMNGAYCASIIIYGVLSEMIGRRYCFIVASALLVLGCFLLLLSHTLTWWLIAAALMGIGIGSGSIVTRVVMKELYHNDEYASKSTVFSTFGLLMLPVSPLLGAGCYLFFGRLSVFVVIMAWGLIQAVLAWRMPETTAEKTIGRDAVLQYLSRLVTEVQHPSVIGYSLITLCAGVILGAWLTMSPVVLIHQYGFSPHAFSAVMLLTNLVPSLFAFLNARWVSRWGYAALLHGAWCVGAVAALLLLLVHVWWSVSLQLFSVAMLMYVVNTLVPSSQIGLVQSLPTRFASWTVPTLTVFTVCWIGGIALGSLIASVLYETSLIALAIVACMSLLGSYVAYRLAIRHVSS